MKKRLLFILGLIFVAANLATAQTKTVTNADLEKFRQKRLQAERDYRENYEKLGFPSPEELERQRVQDRKELSELSARLEKENFEREKKQREDAYWQAQNDASRSYNNQYNQGAYYGNGYYSSGYFGAYPFYGFSGGYYNNYYNNRFGRNRGFRRGGNFYNPIIPGTVFPPRGIRINNGGVRIGVTGGSRFPSSIRSPR
ncbi:MAG: hypothetical protein ACR2MG_02665 [Pyrinomonadaceae bacterium]